MERSSRFAIAAGLLVGIMVLGRFVDLEDPGEVPEELPATPPASVTPGPAFPESPPEVKPPDPDSANQAHADPATQADSGSPPDELDYEYRATTVPMSSSGPPVDPINEWERAFQKEERDEAWARPLEAEIRTSLDPEVSLGHFYVSNIECRTTLCEVRLLARGSLQSAELDRMQTEIHELPWASNLTAMLSGGASSGDSYEAIWIFEKKTGTAAR